jgi:nucleolar protein 4
LKDKTTKLQSPIFFINPFRLSLRNLAKHVDEIQLRTLCEQGTKKGLQTGLVSAKDYIAHLRAQGDVSARDILTMIQEKNKENEEIIAPWEESKKSTDYIPSVFIDRDIGSATSRAKGTSRGFGFVEFTHHVHALACLRELNNNPAYSREYVAGGRLAVDMKRKGKKAGVKGGPAKDARIPRLIVDFTVRPRVRFCVSSMKMLPILTFLTFVF